LKGVTATCKALKTGCTNTGGAVATDACIFDCSEKTVGDNSLTWAACQTFDASCSVNADGSKCIAKKATCAEYSTAAGVDCA
jgi:hypothetical protein